jgi:oxygen-independent coproporphyrinogen-3 oxidase
MITAIVNRELYRYEIHSLLKAFYPREEVKVLTQEAAQSRKYQRIAQDPFMEIRFEKSGVTLSFCNGSASTTAESTAYSSSAGSNTASSAAARTAAAPEGVDFTEKSTELKTALKHLLYNALADREKRTLPWGELIGIRPTKIAMNTLLQGWSAEEAAAAMERDHLVSPEKALLSAQIAERERQILSGIHYRGGYSLYVGIPFCPTTCLYCSFPSNNLALWQDRVDAYLDALEQEVAASSALMEGLVLQTTLN